MAAGVLVADEEAAGGTSSAQATRPVTSTSNKPIIGSHRCLRWWLHRRKPRDARIPLVLPDLDRQSDSEMVICISSESRHRGGDCVLSGWADVRIGGVSIATREHGRCKDGFVRQGDPSRKNPPRNTKPHRNFNKNPSPLSDRRRCRASESNRRCGYAPPT